MDPTTPSSSTDNTTMNERGYTENSFCADMVNTLNILIGIIAVVGLAGNVIVMWLLGFQMRRNAFYVYVLNLAGADFLYLCFQAVYFLRNILSQLHISNFNVPIFLFSVLIFAYLAGVCMIAAISVERSLSVLWPIWYHCQRPRRTSSVMCALLWTFSLLLSLLLWKSCYYDRSSCRTYNFIAAAFVVVVSVVPCGSSLALLVRVFFGSHRIPVTRLYVTIALTVLVFLFFGLPFGICWLFLDWVVEFHQLFHCNVCGMTTFLSCVNSSANPIIYFLVGSIRHHRLQRKTLKILLQKAMQDTPGEEGGETGSSGNPGDQETV